MVASLISQFEKRVPPKQSPRDPPWALDPVCEARASRRAVPKPEDPAAGRPPPPDDAREGVKFFPELIVNNAERVIVPNHTGANPSNYRDCFQNGVDGETFRSLKGLSSAGKELNKAESAKQRGDLGGPLVWDAKAMPKKSEQSLYRNMYESPREGVAELRKCVTAGVNTHSLDLVDTNRCVEHEGKDKWKVRLNSLYQVENDANALQRSHRARGVAKGLTAKEREARWMRCMQQDLGAADETQTAITGTAYSVLPSGFQNRRAQELKQFALSYGNLRLPSFDEKTKDPDEANAAPYATIPEYLTTGVSVYGKEFVAHIGKPPPAKKKVRKGCGK